MQRAAGNRVVAAALALGLAATPGISADAGEARPSAVRDLHYGEALFHFYQRDWFTAINRLTAADSQGRLDHHADEAQLLLGGLLVSYGIRDAAHSIFERLLDDTLDAPSRDRAWFYLAKLSHQRGRNNAARAALDRIGEDLDEALEPERHLLDANVLMASGDYAEAARRLEQWRAPKAWRAYADVNLGTALLRAGAFTDGSGLLDKVGTMRVRDAEFLALRDKANVALGFALLAREQADAAVPVLKRVRLDGPFSNKALLGLGWAQAAGQRYGDALVPWLELAGRDALDSAVQESLLAVPYAYGQLGARNRAMDSYGAAIDAYENEIERLRGAISAVHDGALGRLLDGARDGLAGWFWSMDDVTVAPEAQYLYPVLSGHAFQEELKDWRDLSFVSKNLTEWSEKIHVFEAMIANRQAGFASRLTAANAAERDARIAAASARLEAQRDRLSEIERTNDTAALASNEERDWLDTLDAVDTRIAKLSGTRRVDDAADKARLYRGLLTWNLSQQYPERVWAAKKQLRGAEAELADARTRYSAVQQAMQEEPRRIDRLSGRVAALGPRIDALRLRADAALAAQGELIAARTIDALDEQRSRLAAYLVQARFAVATLKDRAAGSLAIAEEQP